MVQDCKFTTLPRPTWNPIKLQTLRNPAITIGQPEKKRVGSNLGLLRFALNSQFEFQSCPQKMAGNISESLKGKKRARESHAEPETADIDHILSLEENLTFSDTLVALRIMREQFPQIDKPIQPFILRSQLYSSVEDRTQVDRDLETLRREKVLRIFKLNTGQDDHAIMFLDDYLCQVDQVVKRLEGQKGRDVLEVFNWFRSHVIDFKLEPSIEHQELCTLLSLGGKVKDEHISLLMNSGLLTRQLIDPNIYWFAIPNIGSVLKGLSQGRKEVLSLLNRRRYKEMMLAPLEKKRLRFSSLDMRFHLRDLIGSGHLKTVQIPTGIVVRVSKD